MVQNQRVLTAECPQFLLYLSFLLTQQYGKQLQALWVMPPWTGRHGFSDCSNRAGKQQVFSSENLLLNRMKGTLKLDKNNFRLFLLFSYILLLRQKNISNSLKFCLSVNISGFCPQNAVAKLSTLLQFSERKAINSQPDRGTAGRAQGSELPASFCNHSKELQTQTRQLKRKKQLVTLKISKINGCI